MWVNWCFKFFLKNFYTVLHITWLKFMFAHIKHIRQSYMELYLYFWQYKSYHSESHYSNMRMESQWWEKVFPKLTTDYPLFHLIIIIIPAEKIWFKITTPCFEERTSVRVPKDSSSNGSDQEWWGELKEVWWKLNDILVTRLHTRMYVNTPLRSMHIDVTI